uniref:Protein misato homolog 1 n=1 Tax=Leptobrachium leishanense TaxID=445787 RepID=A0A8C5PH56_9ANUR
MGEQCGEVVTLQLGHYASFVGTHWWNLQTAMRSSPLAQNVDLEICSDVLFRQGVTLRGLETYTPRLILMDLKGSLDSLREEGYLYEDKRTMRSTPGWRGILTTHQEEPSQRNPFLSDSEMPCSHRQEGAAFPQACSGVQDVKDGLTGNAGKSCTWEQRVNVWSDLLQTDLHMKSVCVINRYNHGGETDTLDSFGQGEALLKESCYLDDLEDRLHFFTEECDYLQGFQVLCDLHNGFSGVGAQVAEFLRDQYPGRGILTWGTSPVQPGEADFRKRTFQMLNTIMGTVKMSSVSSLFCPLSLNSSLGRRPGVPTSLPHVLYDPVLPYHSSAILALALETLTAPYRLRSSPLPMQHLAEALNTCGRKVVRAVASLPFPIQAGSSLPDALLSHMTSAPWSSLTPCGTSGLSNPSNCFSQCVVLRGIRKDQQRSYQPRGARSLSVLHAQDTGPETLQCYLQSLYPQAVSVSHLLQAPCKLPSAFPQFFSPQVSKDGFIQLSERPKGVEHIPVLAALQTSEDIHRLLNGLDEEVKKLDVRRFSTFFTTGVEQEDFEEALHQMQDLAQCYSDSRVLWPSSSPPGPTSAPWLPPPRLSWWRIPLGIS